MNRYQALLTLLMLLSGCFSPYKVNDRPAPIAGVMSQLRMAYINQYYDSVADVFAWNHPPDTWTRDFAITNLDGVVESRVYYFREAPQEMYYVRFTSPIVISAVYDGKRYSTWTYGDEVKKAERKRIEDRFFKEVIGKMEIYGLQKGIPDSVLYLRW